MADGWIPCLESGEAADIVGGLFLAGCWVSWLEVWILGNGASILWRRRIRYWEAGEARGSVTECAR